MTSRSSVGASDTQPLHFSCVLKSWNFKNVATAIKLTENLTQATFQGLRFEGCTVGIEASSGGIGNLTVLDSSAASTPMFLVAAALKGLQGSLVLENVIVDDSVKATVKTGTTIPLTGSVTPGTTWIRGSVYSGTTSASSQSLTNTGTKLTTSRPATLINSTTGAYHTVVPPTYTDYPLARVLNAKAVPSDPVLGDGKTDDMASLQAIITSAAQADQLLFFPQGTYILTDTLQLPPGGRLVGEAWTRLTPRGAKFKDAKNPRPMVRVGQPGDVGVAQMTDFLFYPTGSKEDVNLPRLVMVEVNMAGARPGDVGVFNSHFLMVGGTARLCAHFTETASVYWENSWATAQDNSVSGLGFGGEFLVEARGGTWMVGVETEHHVLYQLNFHNAKDVFVGLEQGEGPYWHGQGNTPLPPAPFANSLRPSDPDFSWCPADDAECRMALYQHVTNSTGVNLYGGAFWNFRAGASQSLCTGDCQTNTVLYENNQKLYSYGIGTINDKNMVLETGPGGNAKTVAAVRDANFGFPLSGFTIHWPAFVAAYLRQSV